MLPLAIGAAQAVGGGIAAKYAMDKLGNRMPGLGGGGDGGMSPEQLMALQRQQAQMREESLARITGQMAQQREADLAKGAARGKELFGKTFIEESRPERSADIADVIARRKAALQGFSGEENTALREQMAQAQARQEQGALRQLRGVQAQQGIRGGLAGAQQAQQLAQNQAQRAAAERELFLQNIAQRQQALGNFEQSARAAEAEEIGRFGQRRFGQLGTELGYGQLGAADRAAAMGQILGEQQAQTAALMGQGGGGKKGQMQASPYAQAAQRSSANLGNQMGGQAGALGAARQFGVNIPGF